MSAIELGAPYYVYNPDQSDYFVVNVPTDPNFVGYAQDVTGLDDAEVRENAQNITAGDGGYQGRFWVGRRPWTISGFILPTLPTAARSASADRISDIMGQCMSGDGYLQWYPSDGIPKFIRFKKQQPFRDTKGQSNVERNFAIAGVSADWRVLAAGSMKNITKNGPCPSLGAGFLTAVTDNFGSAPASPLFTVTGPMNGVFIRNMVTGVNFEVDVVVNSLDSIVIDLTSGYPTITESAFGVDIAGKVNSAVSDYSIAVQPTRRFPNQYWSCSEVVAMGSAISTSASALTVQWRDSWR